MTKSFCVTVLSFDWKGFAYFEDEERESTSKLFRKYTWTFANHYSVNCTDNLIFEMLKLQNIIFFIPLQISDERLKVPIVEKFEGSCGFVEQYISARWSVPTGETNNVSFSMAKSADNSSYTLKGIRVHMVLDEVNFPEAEHAGKIYKVECK